ncbi:MAG: uridine kinase [Peptoniphilaceae bacterium]|uniref:uridine kinase n=2 Tax=Parvimonas sp. TaxID=1944660 RepID=UPI0025EF2DB5|nr:uridine kinase [Parvimonas sp.]MCI5997547.1 uridine kinase [Parvimonas sp.]MDD7765525.1 uridine kinase [Peptoniphilaceae bacterium]MDY3051066.1 uridine kinase [Parvimonas sp.]
MKMEYSSNDICVIGIAGGSASGKTTIIEKLKQKFKDEIVLISHDYYYWCNDHLSMEERVKLNYDHPKSFETDKLIEDLKSLKEGKIVDLPIYDFTIHTRKKETLRVYPRPVIIVEGILILENKELRDLMDIKVYVDTDADERLIRRLLRDTKERGRSVDSVLTQYIKTVKPMHEEFVEPSKKHADIIIPRGAENKPAMNILIQHLKTLLK